MYLLSALQGSIWDSLTDFSVNSQRERELQTKIRDQEARLGAGSSNNEVAPLALSLHCFNFSKTLLALLPMWANSLMARYARDFQNMETVVVAYMISQGRSTSGATTGNINPNRPTRESDQAIQLRDELEDRPDPEHTQSGRKVAPTRSSAPPLHATGFRALLHLKSSQATPSQGSIQA